MNKIFIYQVKINWNYFALEIIKGVSLKPKIFIKVPNY